MQIHLFCVFDKQLEEFNTPMAFPSRGVAIRSFCDEVKREASENQMRQHPEDFSLWYVGTFDSVQGEFGSPFQPEKLIEASAA